MFVGPSLHENTRVVWEMLDQRHAPVEHRLGRAADLQPVDLLHHELGRAIVAAECDDAAILDLDTAWQLRIGREDVDDLSSNRDLARFVNHVVDHVTEFAHRIHECLKLHRFSCLQDRWCSFKYLGRRIQPCTGFARRDQDQTGSRGCGRDADAVERGDATFAADGGVASPGSASLPGQNNTCASGEAIATAFAMAWARGSSAAT